MKSARKKLHRIRPKLDKSLRTLKRRSFTLIELLIVIAILGILAAAVLVAINPGKRTGQARDAQRKTDLSQIQSALESYFIFNGQYPPVGCGGNPDCLGWTDQIQGTCGSTQLVDALVLNGWLKKVPEDPLASPSNNYHYFYQKSSRESYHLGSLLENSSDPKYLDPPTTWIYCSGSSVDLRYLLPI